MEDIGYSSKGVEEKINNFKACKGEIEKCRDDLNKTLEGISEAWQGADATLYIDKMRDDYLFSFESLITGFEECIKHLENHVPKDYEAHDNKWQGTTIEV